MESHLLGTQLLLRSINVAGVPELKAGSTIDQLVNVKFDARFTVDKGALCAKVPVLN